MSDLVVQFMERFGKVPGVCARAPGRVEFIGNHTDYNGGEVLGAAINLDLRVAVAARTDAIYRFCTTTSPEILEWSEDDLQEKKAEGWAAYPLGVWNALRDEGFRWEGGCDFMVDSDLPSGAGLSSSAAFELASAIAFEALCGRSMDTLQRVRACRRAENDYVGVPCGILDQGVSGFGEKGRLVHIDCRTETISTVEGPRNARLWVFQSGKKHSLVDSLYSMRHGECQQALDYFRGKRKDIDYLVDVSAEELATAETDMDPVLWKRACHIIREQQRVRKTVKALERGDLQRVGSLLCESHWSSSKCFENSIPELDALVKILSEKEGVYGARLTGGGFGGAVMALANDAFSTESAQTVSKEYKKMYAHRANFIPLEIGDGASLLDVE